MSKYFKYGKIFWFLGLYDGRFCLLKWVVFLGLLSDDITRDNEITAEALRRLPKDVYQERQWRHARAISFNANKDVLPESEWLKPEQVGLIVAF